MAYLIEGDRAYFSNGKMRFQSSFMLITTQPRRLASSMSSSENVPILEFTP
ncbi:MAG: hypothetical protein JOZ63_06900 [Planctomycetaceae bacterium]|nr:hypothetical protein [Planctomycetaceae bacterium]